jgi:hypothetical protein
MRSWHLAVAQRPDYRSFSADQRVTAYYFSSGFYRFRGSPIKRCAWSSTISTALDLSATRRPLTASWDGERADYAFHLQL